MRGGERSPDYIVFLHSSYGWDFAAGGGRAEGRPGVRG